MKLSRKIEKLFRREALASLRDHLRRATHPVSAPPILARIDDQKLRDLQSRYPEGEGHPKINRFANPRRLIKENIERAQDLWLDKAPPLRILDLGSGPNYFLFVCRHLGHDGISVDVDEQPLFRETTELLGIPRVIHRIEAQTPLPDFCGRFDLVTAHRVCFYKIERGANRKWIEWSPDDWRFFINDVRTRVLKPGGRLLLDFNPRPGEGRYFRPEVRDVLLEEGAAIVRSRALLAADPKATAAWRL